MTDDRARSRLTVFFRLLLAIPHLVWYLLWSLFAALIAVVGWFAALFTGRLPQGLHEFLAMYIRYSVHLQAYILLAANPYPGFVGSPGYPIDVEIDGPERQSRWKVGFRLVLALPALLVAGALLGGPGGPSSPGGDPEGAELAYAAFGGVADAVALLAWFACLARGRMPQGFRDLLVYALRYDAQTTAYLFLVTERYPSADPFGQPVPEPPPRRPVRILIEDDLARSRLTVFFRLPLAVPHLVWLTLWGIAAWLAAIASWFATLARGRSPAALHRFLAAYVRYQTHVYAFLFLAANPFPGFTGRAGSYPVDLEVDGPERQNRWITGFRLVLALPAWIVSGGLGGLLVVVAVLGWFVSLALGRMPVGFRNAAAFAIRYSAQTNAYGLLLTDRYPYSGPAERRVAEPVEPEEAPPAPGAGLAAT